MKRQDGDYGMPRFSTRNLLLKCLLLKSIDFEAMITFLTSIFSGPSENESLDARPAAVLEKRAVRLGALPPAILLRPQALHEKRIH